MIASTPGSTDMPVHGQEEPCAASTLMSVWGAAGRTWSAAMTGDIDRRLREHLVRTDGQEEICFALYRTSAGATRDTAIIYCVVLPAAGERHVHGNASFTGEYFLRAAGLAAEDGAGLALLHTHPKARTWQKLSCDDRVAEAGHAMSALTMTDLPLLGITLAGAASIYSARFWPDRDQPEPRPEWVRSVRIIGPGVRIIHNPDQAPPPAPSTKLMRTTHSWGESVQADIARLKVGVIGAGSVAELVGEALVRTGIANIDVLDFDSVEEHNLDRLLFATEADIGAAKSQLLATWLSRHAVAEHPIITYADLSVVEPDGWARALDCDVLFSCVDRPWGRYALNVAAYAHLIPVVDGGVSVDIDDPGCMGAEWRAHMCAPGRRCLECLGQYDPGAVGIERAGLLDDPNYIDELARGHHLRRRENVFVFSMACAAAEVLELLRAIVEPAGISDVGAVLAHWSTGTVDRDERDCAVGCPFTGPLVAAGDSAPVDVTGRHMAAVDERRARATAPRRRAPVGSRSRQVAPSRLKRDARRSWCIAVAGAKNFRDRVRRRRGESSDLCTGRSPRRHDVGPHGVSRAGSHRRRSG